MTHLFPLTPHQHTLAAVTQGQRTETGAYQLLMKEGFYRCFMRAGRGRRSATALVDWKFAMGYLTALVIIRVSPATVSGLFWQQHSGLDTEVLQVVIRTMEEMIPGDQLLEKTRLHLQIIPQRINLEDPASH